MGAARRKDGTSHAVLNSGDGLVVYSAACRALAAARTTDEVRHIRDKAAMLRAYAKQAKNRQLEIDAAEIRIRAERRVGELMQAQRETVGVATGREGKRRSLGSNPDPSDRPTLADAGIDKHLADRGRKLADIPEQRFETLVTHWRDRVANDGERVTADLLRTDKLAVHHSTETPEHYTPAGFLEAVSAVFGGVPDLDPCSNVGTPNVAAKAHYTAAENGLERPWRGRVFVNPPYGREIVEWVRKIRAEWAEPPIKEIIALLPSRTDTEWFDMLTAGTDDAVICFLRGRLTFVGNSDPAPFPSMAVYFGPKHDVFAEVFGELGTLWCRPSAPREWFVSHLMEIEACS